MAFRFLPSDDNSSGDEPDDAGSVGVKKGTVVFGGHSGSPPPPVLFFMNSLRNYVAFFEDYGSFSIFWDYASTPFLCFAGLRSCPPPKVLFSRVRNL